MDHPLAGSGGDELISEAELLASAASAAGDTSPLDAALASFQLSPPVDAHPPLDSDLADLLLGTGTGPNPAPTPAAPAPGAPATADVPFLDPLGAYGPAQPPPAAPAAGPAPVSVPVPVAASAPAPTRAPAPAPAGSSSPPLAAGPPPGTGGPATQDDPLRRPALSNLLSRIRSSTIAKPALSTLGEAPAGHPAPASTVSPPSSSPDLTLTPARLDSINYQDPAVLRPMMTPFYREYFRRYQLLIEFKNLSRSPPPGMYLIPSSTNILEWHGVFFPYRGPYSGAVLRFIIILSPDYPMVAPAVVFVPSIHHPLIDLNNGHLSLEARFHDWHPTRHRLHHVVLYIRYVLENVSHLKALAPEQCVNQFAHDQLCNHPMEFTKIARDCVRLSTNSVQTAGPTPSYTHSATAEKASAAIHLFPFLDPAQESEVLDEIIGTNRLILERHHRQAGVGSRIASFVSDVRGMMSNVGTAPAPGSATGTPVHSRPATVGSLSASPSVVGDNASSHRAAGLAGSPTPARSAVAQPPGTGPAAARK
ncbi:hypothetical protein H696_04032 [Fonticula alba]|uniref:UBC core domain-containing protein n=1 Tax=Fonticula alba TaxID=691883 RepID=A0A058Z6R3_FONAL|nr:hypothetical protein H696_04032 [Fonticula alba]KCV69613.1 hypothetical protein H696_04032 [Fonticula alba]|eukprot:XP_009496178.1 hypothetical protein H696_04032 [Fonticula alba]